MGSPFLFFIDERLSRAELTAARLDGDLIEVGEAFMPADAVETRELRAASVRPLIPDKLTLTRASAAWVHGAVGEPPPRHTVQRVSPLRIHHLFDPRLSYSDQRVESADTARIGGVRVTTPTRTLCDAARDLCAGVPGADALVDALLHWRPALLSEGLTALERSRPLHFKRPALAYLRARAQEEVTR